MATLNLLYMVDWNLLLHYSPVKDTVVVNDRWGKGDQCKHGGYFTCHDRFNPGQLLHVYKVCIYRICHLNSAYR